MPTAVHPKQESEQSQKPTRPAAEFRDYNLRVTIWQSPDSEGIARHNVVLTRSYQSNGIWKETPYLGKLDLQRAAKLLNRADDWIFNDFAREREAAIQEASA